MALNYSIGDTKTQACSLSDTLCGEKWIKDFFSNHFDIWSQIHTVCYSLRYLVELNLKCKASYVKFLSIPPVK
jgi:hypothetical protein